MTLSTSKDTRTHKYLVYSDVTLHDKKGQKGRKGKERKRNSKGIVYDCL